MLVLPLALWSVVPGIRWCSLGWEDVRPECFTSCAVAEVVTAPCPAADASCPAAAAPEGCCGDPESCDAAAGASSSDAAPATEYPGGRAFCLGGPSGGNGVTSVSPVPDAPGPSAILPHTPAITVAHALERRAFRTVVVHPPPSPAGAVPRTRAPPESVAITC
ncbi:MAG TPA: hypothetical protein VJY35_16020 [Candidatus Eisenbacteria bacterium]|nr:hypothetical protein [Candidatus Eisenbacteria bacterium]